MSFELTTPKKLKWELEGAGKKHLALDIDETLSYTNGHWVKELGKHIESPTGMTSDEIAHKYRMVQNVPHFQNEKANGKIKEFLHSNKFQETIPLIEHSNKIVNKINSTIPIAAYITCRPISIAEGTRKWLTKHKFPEAALVMKPMDVVFENNSAWKAEILSDLFPELVGIVDNDPTIAEELSKRDYMGTFYLYDWIEGLDTNSSTRIVPCKTWNDVESSVLNDHENLSNRN